VEASVYHEAGQVRPAPAPLALQHSIARLRRPAARSPQCRARVDASCSPRLGLGASLEVSPDLVLC
jgi:hypothetical protein